MLWQVEPTRAMYSQLRSTWSPRDAFRVQQSKPNDSIATPGFEQVLNVASIGLSTSTDPIVRVLLRSEGVRVGGSHQAQERTRLNGSDEVAAPPCRTDRPSRSIPSADAVFSRSLPTIQSPRSASIWRIPSTVSHRPFVSDVYAKPSGTGSPAGTRYVHSASVGPTT